MTDVTVISNTGKILVKVYLKSAGEELVLDLKEVSLANIHLERLVDDGKTNVVLNVLPTTIAVGDNAGQQPVVMPVNTASQYSKCCRNFQ